MHDRGLIPTSLYSNNAIGHQFGASHAQNLIKGDETSDHHLGGDCGPLSWSITKFIPLHA